MDGKIGGIWGETAPDRRTSPHASGPPKNLGQAAPHFAFRCQIAHPISLPSQKFEASLLACDAFTRQSLCRSGPASGDPGAAPFATLPCSCSYFVRAGGTPGLRAPWQATPDAGRFWRAQQTATAMRCAVPAMRCMQSARMREDGSLTGRLVATPSGRQSDAAQSPRRRNPTLRRRATRLLLDSLTLPPDYLESILRPPTLDQRLPGRKWQIPPPPRFAEASVLRPRRRARLGEWWAGLGPASQRVVCPMGTKGTK